MGLVFDASSLIILQELGLLTDVLNLRISLVVTEQVSREVQSASIRKLTMEGKFASVRANSRLVPADLAFRLGPGEVSVLAYAREYSHYWAVLDERLARAAARKLQIRFLGTARLIKHLGDSGLMTMDRVRVLLYSMPRVGFHIEPETIEAVLRESRLHLE